MLSAQMTGMLVYVCVCVCIRVCIRVCVCMCVLYRVLLSPRGEARLKARHWEESKISDDILALTLRCMSYCSHILYIILIQYIYSAHINMLLL